MGIFIFWSQVGMPWGSRDGDNVYGWGRVAITRCGKATGEKKANIQKLAMVCTPQDLGACVREKCQGGRVALPMLIGRDLERPGQGCDLIGRSGRGVVRGC